MFRVFAVAAFLLIAASRPLASGNSSSREPQGVTNTKRPQAPEVWAFRVEYRERRSPQFPWGDWHHAGTFRGDYNTAASRANKLADLYVDLSKNVQTQILQTRIR